MARLDNLFLPNLALVFGYLPGTTWSFLGLTNSETTLYIVLNARNVALGEREELGRLLPITAAIYFQMQTLIFWGKVRKHSTQ